MLEEHKRWSMVAQVTRSGFWINSLSGIFDFLFCSNYPRARAQVLTEHAEFTTNGKRPKMFVLSLNDVMNHSRTRQFYMQDKNRDNPGKHQRCALHVFYEDNTARASDSSDCHVMSSVLSS